MSHIGLCSYNLTIMMEPVFSFLPSYLSIIFLTKGKISKFAGLFLSNTRPKRCLSIRLQHLKLSISLEQSDEIVYFFTCSYQNLRLYRKILGWVWSEMVVATLVTRQMDEWIDELSWFFLHANTNSGKLRSFWVVVGKNGHGTVFPEWMDKCG